MHVDRPKPAHLGQKYGAQFQDPAVVDAYIHRPPYSPDVSDIVAQRAPSPNPRLLELGCGSGDLTIHLDFAGRVDALDPSRAMLASLRARRSTWPFELRIIQGSAEDAPLDPPYDLVVAGESLHWMEWAIVLPRLAHVLADGGVLAVVNRRQAPMAGQEQIQALIEQYSTNRDYAPYDLIEELSARGLFEEHGRQDSARVPFTQSTDAIIESLHSRNGFSRDRMTPAAAQACDTYLRAIITSRHPTGSVTLTTWSTVVWGMPFTPHRREGGNL